MTLRTLSALLLALPLLAAPTLASAGHPAGVTLSDAATVDVTPEGLAVATDILPELLPSDLAVPDLGEGARTGFPDCLAAGYEYALSGLTIDFAIANAAIVPNTGRLDLEVELLVSVNASSDPFSVYGMALCIEMGCDGYVEPFTATLTTSLGLQVVPDPTTGEPTLDATVGALALDNTLSGNDINIEGCALATFEDILNFFGLSLFDLILGIAEPLIDDLVTDFGPEIETLLEDTFSQVSIDEELDLEGIPLSLQLYPGDVEIAPAGIRIFMDGGVNTPVVAQCVDAYDEGESLATDSAPPALGAAPAGVSSDYHAALNLSDDFGNQALYSLWRGGLLCVDVDEELIGFGLDTSLLNGLADDVYSDLFPESRQMTISTRPQEPPTLVFDGDSDVGLAVDKLGLDFYAELDGREARIVGLDVGLVAGADLEFDGETGNLEVLVDLGTDALTAVVTDNEFKPGSEAAIESNFAGLFDSIIGSVVGGLVEDLAFALPSISGLGLTDLALEGAGADQDWLGGFAYIGTVDYGGDAAGCGDDASGCEGGCAAGGPSGGRVFLGLVPLALVTLRRREDA